MVRGRRAWSESRTLTSAAVAGLVDGEPRMKVSRGIAFAAGLGTLFLGGSAYAVRQPAHLLGKPALEVASGPAVRPIRMVSYQHVPRKAQRAWERLLGEMGAAHQASWDEATGVPTRIFGAGMAAPHTVSSAKDAEAFARAFLERHIELLAPGALPSDFTLVTNDLERGLRTVGFLQHSGGVRVIGGQLSFRFKADRLVVIASEALPWARAASPKSVLDAGKARDAATSWILADAGQDALATDVDGPFILPLVRANGHVAYRSVLRVNVAVKSPIGRWSVYVDAQTGAPVAREQMLRFAQGTALYNAPERYPLSTRLDYPAGFANQLVNGVQTTSAVDGTVTFPDGPDANLLATVVGPRVRVLNDVGAEATQGFSLPPGGTVTWNAANTESVDSQLSTFIHAHKVKAYTKNIAPSMAWLDTQLQATVNINDTCNAFSDGDSINFFHADGMCENTGRLADVVYHEFGHSFHNHATLQGSGAFEGALSEGVSDYLAATITGDHGMGRGFFFDDSPLRDIDPPNDENVWPDDLINEVHEDGLIIAGTLWDLRKGLVTKLGQDLGVAHTDQLFYMAIKNASDIPTMYVEVLTADDDDGNLDNGTPNGCEINDAFSLHGLAALSVETDTPGATPPTQDGFTIGVKVKGIFAQCTGAATARIEWHLRADPATSGMVQMTGTADQFTGVIPSQPEGNVVQYQVVISLGNGDTLSFPDNPADPWYELYVGTVEPIYCTNFETDPELDGWTHGLTSGDPVEGADDWQWGTANGNSTNGDAPDAFSGANVFGNDLALAQNFNGLYQPDKVNFALSPEIDTTGYEGVRLQYRRWLNVEDGFFDQGTIYANDQLAWTNLNSDQGNSSNVSHRDREWRFQDVDLAPFVQGGKVRIKYEIASDGGLEFGGWTIDDFCVVGAIAAPIPPVPACGNGVLEGTEECDNGDANSDTAPDACRSDCRPALCGDGVMDTSETCDDGNAQNGDGCETSCQTTVVVPPGGGPSDPAEDPFEVEDGCGCRVTGSRPAGSSGSPDGRAIAAIGLALALARRRTRR
jgi:cysteine-rich repeat protein